MAKEDGLLVRFEVYCGRVCVWEGCCVWERIDREKEYVLYFFSLRARGIVGFI